MKKVASVSPVSGKEALSEASSMTVMSITSLLSASFNEVS